MSGMGPTLDQELLNTINFFSKFISVKHLKTSIQQNFDALSS